MEAQRVASLVFREAAIELLWLDRERSSIEEADSVLRIHCCFAKLRSKLDRRTLGFAVAGGRCITVFRDNIQIMAVSVGRPESWLLGYVMTHELGHQLLPAGYHSPHGIMQDHLSYEYRCRVRGEGKLFFSEKEASQMRAALTGGSK